MYFIFNHQVYPTTNSKINSRMVLDLPGKNRRCKARENKMNVNAFITCHFIKVSSAYIGSIFLPLLSLRDINSFSRTLLYKTTFCIFLPEDRERKADLDMSSERYCSFVLEAARGQKFWKSAVVRQKWKDNTYFKNSFSN